MNKIELTPIESEQFWSKINKTDSCWLWTGNTNRYGYFTFRHKSVRAHRLSFVIHGGVLTKEKPFVLHNCPDGDNPLCVNPGHLWAGTQRDNVLDMEAKGRAYHPSGDRNGMRTKPESILRGSQQTNSKLTESQVLEIYETCKNGKLGIKTETAKKFNVTSALIGNIANGRAWNHVTGLPKRRLYSVI